MQIWPLLMVYVTAVIAWLILWPFMNYVPACAGHSFASPAYRVLTVAVLSPMKFVMSLWESHKKPAKPASGGQSEKMQQMQPVPTAPPVQVDKV